MFKWLSLSLLVVILDQVTKHLASDLLELHHPVSVAPWVYFTLMHNAGAAFSFLSSAGGWQRWFFVILALAVSGGILYWLMSLPREARWLPIALALVLGGAIGNVWDRVAFGYVVDFVQVYIPFLPWRIFNPWPAFNVADSAISVGAVMLVIDAFIPEK